MGKLGDRLNKIKTKKIPITLDFAGETYKMFFDLGLPDSIMIEARTYALERVKSGDDAAVTDEMVRYIAAIGLKDEDGKTVWDRPEDVDPGGVAFSQLKMFVTSMVLGNHIDAFIPDEGQAKK
jgi:hypothetical protein